MHRHRQVQRLKLTLFVLTLATLAATLWSSGGSSAHTGAGVTGSETASIDEKKSAAPAPPQTTAAATQAAPKIEGCISCHGGTEPMHRTRDGKLKDDGTDGQNLTCTYCHGGNPFPALNDSQKSLKRGDKEFDKIMDTSHVRPRFPKEWEGKDGKYSSRNPIRSNTLLAKESREFVRFVNPGDFRATDITCSSSGCHTDEVNSTRNSMMRHGSMLWGAAFYNNGGYPIKDSRFGESYSNEGGAPEVMIQQPPPSLATTRELGIMPFIQPLPRWEISQPGNVLRVFERGGRRRLEVGLPDREEEAGKPDKGLSPRGFGTLNRTDPVYLGLQKTRLLDPTSNFLGTNDYPGDYRSSGCTSCHVIYANDRSVINSSPVWAEYGNRGTTATEDRQYADKKDESGHPIKHQFTSQIPTSQCMVCHMHPGTNMVSTYLGMMWWDNETDAKAGGMYPETQRNISMEEEYTKLERNPEGASVRGNWSDPDFLQKTGTPEFNSKLKRTQFADFHGHGWMFRAVFKKDKEGNYLDVNNAKVENVDAAKMREAIEYSDNDNDDTTGPKPGIPVHLKDIHLEKGMHCVDCHFRQDSHGNGLLYSEPRAAIEIDCIDCHGSVKQPATLVTSGFAAGLNATDPAEGQEIKDGVYKKGQGRNMTNVRALKTPFTRSSGGRQVPVPVFQKITSDQERDDVDGKKVKLKSGDIIQNSMVVPGKWWRIKQTKNTLDEKSPDYNWRSAYAKTVRIGDDKMETWGDVPEDESKLAHANNSMTCYTCHSSWMTSCFGCHLSMRANAKMPNRHNEGGDSRNFTTYNYQVLRDDIFMLGKDGTVTGNRTAPVASRSAVLVSSQNQNREWIYSQQQTVSAEGFAGQSFAPHVPHTVRTKETKGCTDCHVSEKGDNNAWMAQVLLQGTNFVNFMGRYVYVAAEHSLEVATVTEHDEPQAVLGSTLHEAAYPGSYDKFVKGGRQIKVFFEHKGNPEVLGVQVRGEYAYVAAGKGGLRVYDVAQIDHKGFSERITTAPVSRFGQKFWVDTKFATAIAAPSTLAVDPARSRLTSEGKFVAPFDEKFNLTPEWKEWAARWTAWQRMSAVEKAGKPAPFLNEEQFIHPLFAFLYVVDREEGLILVNAATLLDGDPLNNFLKRALTYNPNGVLTGANNITIAGTFAYITTDKGLTIVNLDNPLDPQIVKTIGEPELKHPHSIAVQFRYGFVVDEEGFKVIDLTMTPNARGFSVPRGEIIKDAEVPLGHAHDVYVARTYAYVANGKEGLAIIDVKEPEKPRLYMKYNGDGEGHGGKEHHPLDDTHQVKVAMTNASLFAYVADGHNGLRILQLTSPETEATYAGFSPAPKPRLIANFHTAGPAVAVSKGLDRDRAVDESGNQISVFGRRGARPFTLAEQQKLYLLDGRLRTVLDADTLTAPPPKKRDPFASSSTSTEDSARGKAKPDGKTVGGNSAPGANHSSGAMKLISTKLVAGSVGGLGFFVVIMGWRRRKRLRK